jgi:hypothetical protein
MFFQEFTTEFTTEVTEVHRGGMLEIPTNRENFLIFVQHLQLASEVANGWIVGNTNESRKFSYFCTAFTTH